MPRKPPRSCSARAWWRSSSKMAPSWNGNWAQSRNNRWAGVKGSTDADDLIFDGAPAGAPLETISAAAADQLLPEGRLRGDDNHLVTFVLHFQATFARSDKIESAFASRL